METAVVKAYRNTNAVRRFFNGTLGTIFCILLIMILFFNEGGAMVVRLIVLGIIFLGLQLGKKGILKYLDRQEYLFYEDRIEVAGWKKKEISYDEILTALQTRRIQVRKEMFCIPIGEEGFLKLQYEIGEKRRERKQRDFDLCADSWLFAGGNWRFGDGDDDGYSSCFTAYVSFYDVSPDRVGKKSKS